MALAIGDGANDVGMILQADVGVGISGKEGRQAVLAADYAISQFRYLQRLLLVHGRMNFYRNVDLVNYSFYKNMAFSFNQILFGFLSRNSGNTMYDSMLYTVYNVIFTSAPPVVYAGLEKDVKESEMMLHPELYHFEKNRKWIASYGRFWLFLVMGIYHGICSMAVSYFALDPFTYSDGKVFGLKEFGTTVYMGVVTLVNFTIAVMSSYWTWLHHFFYWLSILIFIPVVIVIDKMELTSDYRGITMKLMTSPNFWSTVVGIAVVGMVPIVFVRAVTNSFNSLRNRVAHFEREKRVFSDYHTNDDMSTDEHSLSDISDSPKQEEEPIAHCVYYISSDSGDDTSV